MFDFESLPRTALRQTPEAIHRSDVPDMLVLAQQACHFGSSTGLLLSFDGKDPGPKFTEHEGSFMTVCEHEMSFLEDAYGDKPAADYADTVMYEFERCAQHFRRNNPDLPAWAIWYALLDIAERHFMTNDVLYESSGRADNDPDHWPAGGTAEWREAGVMVYCQTLDRLLDAAPSPDPSQIEPTDLMVEFVKFLTPLRNRVKSLRVSQDTYPKGNDIYITWISGIANYSSIFDKVGKLVGEAFPMLTDPDPFRFPQEEGIRFSVTTTTA